MPRKKARGGPPPTGRKRASPTPPEANPEDGPLNRQVRFALKFVQLGCNRLRAMKAAGYKGNDNSLQTTAWRLLQKAKVREVLAQVRADGIVDAIESLYSMSEIARSSLDDVLDEAGMIDPVRARELGKLHLVHELTEEVWMEKTGDVDENGRPEWGQIRQRKVKLYSRADALKTLMKYHGLLADVIAMRDIPKTAEEAKVLLAKELRRIYGDKLPPGMIPPDVLALMEAQGGVQ